MTPRNPLPEPVVRAMDAAERPGRVRIDRGVVVESARTAPGLCRGRLTRGPHAIITIATRADAGAHLPTSVRLDPYLTPRP